MFISRIPSQTLLMNNFYTRTFTFACIFNVIFYSLNTIVAFELEKVLDIQPTSLAPC